MFANEEIFPIMILINNGNPKNDLFNLSLCIWEIEFFQLIIPTLTELETTSKYNPIQSKLTFLWKYIILKKMQILISNPIFRLFYTKFLLLLKLFPFFCWGVQLFKFLPYLNHRFTSISKSLYENHLKKSILSLSVTRLISFFSSFNLSRTYEKSERLDPVGS